METSIPVGAAPARAPLQRAKPVVAAGKDARRPTPGRVRAFARALRHTPDRLLHPWRRRRVLAALAAARPARVLFVCYGNICRSPYAAAAFRALLRDEPVVVESAGFVGAGRPVPGEGRSAAARRGVELSRHRSQLITADLVASADLVVVMDGAQKREVAARFGRAGGLLVLGDVDPEPIETRTVRDPFNQTEIVFDRVYDRIDRCLLALARTLRHRG